MATTTAGGLRLMIESTKSAYGDAVPELDEDLYKGRSYSLAAAKCYAAAYAAAACFRDNMAMQFYRYALRISDALTPEYPMDVDENKNAIEREDDQQRALNSELQASQMAMASQYGLLTYLAAEKQGAQFLFLSIYHDAHTACKKAHDESKDLRHSPIDIQFAEVMKDAVKSIGVFYNHELEIWTEPVTALKESRLPKLSPDVYIAETEDQRRHHSQSDFDSMVAKEQAHLGLLAAKRKELNTKLFEMAAKIKAQLEAAKEADKVHEAAKDAMDSARRALEDQNGKLSEMSMDRSDLRVRLASLDGDHFRLMERLQTLINLNAAT